MKKPRSVFLYNQALMTVHLLRCLNTFLITKEISADYINKGELIVRQTESQSYLHSIHSIISTTVSNKRSP